MKHDLAREISTWVDGEIITEEQATKICDIYDVDYNESKDRSWGYRILVLLGYLFIGLSVITLLGANWEEIPRSFRMLGLIALTMGTHSLGLRKYLKAEHGAATGLFFLGNLFFGASIILIGQIYHLGQSIPDEIFWWAIGTLPFGVLLKNRWLNLLTSALALIWFFVELDGGDFPLWYPMFTAATLYVVARSKTSGILFLTALGGFVLWFESALGRLWVQKNDVLPEQFIVGVSICLLLVGLGYFLNSKDESRSKDYGAILSVWTLRFGVFTGLVFSFREPWGELMRTEWSHLPSMFVVCTAIVLAAAYLAHQSKRLPALLGFAIPVALMTMTVISFPSGEAATLLQIVTNIALIVSGVTLIVRGIDGGVSHYFFVGIATILLTALLRYIDLIGDYIGGAILFAVFALVLLGAAKLWRRKLTNGGAA